MVTLDYKNLFAQVELASYANTLSSYVMVQGVCIDNSNLRGIVKSAKALSGIPAVSDHLWALNTNDYYAAINQRIHHPIEVQLHGATYFEVFFEFGEMNSLLHVPSCSSLQELADYCSLFGFAHQFGVAYSNWRNVTSSGACAIEFTRMNLPSSGFSKQWQPALIDIDGGNPYESLRNFVEGVRNVHSNHLIDRIIDKLDGFWKISLLRYKMKYLYDVGRHLEIQDEFLY